MNLLLKKFLVIVAALLIAKKIPCNRGSAIDRYTGCKCYPGTVAGNDHPGRLHLPDIDRRRYCIFLLRATSKGREHGKLTSKPNRSASEAGSLSGAFHGSLGRTVANRQHFTTDEVLQCLHSPDEVSEYKNRNGDQKPCTAVTDTASHFTASNQR